MTALEPDGIDRLLREWSARGFVPTRITDGREVSNDVCASSTYSAESCGLAIE